jgi:hypothetical protein
MMLHVNSKYHEFILNVDREKMGGIRASIESTIPRIIMVSNTIIEGGYAVSSDLWDTEHRKHEP